MVFIRKTKILLFALAVCIVFPVFFTETLAVAKLDHDCIEKIDSCHVPEEEENCQPCLQIQAAEHFLKTLRLTIIFSSSPVSSLSFVQTSENLSYHIFCPLSPIELKVRFNT